MRCCCPCGFRNTLRREAGVVTRQRYDGRRGLRPRRPGIVPAVLSAMANGESEQGAAIAAAVLPAIAQL